MAEELAESNAHGVQRLLAEADWDEEGVRDDRRADVIEHLAEAGAILEVDETGFLFSRKGNHQQEWRDRTAERQADGRIVRWGSFSCIVARKGRPSSTGPCICLRSGPVIACAVGKQALPRRWSLPPKVNWPGTCWREPL